MLSQDNVTLVTGAHVQRLETDASGRTVTGVVTTLDDGSETTFTGDVVVVACGAVNSAALLLQVSPATATRTGWPTAPEWSAGTTCGTTTSR